MITDIKMAKNPDTGNWVTKIVSDNKRAWYHVSGDPISLETVIAWALSDG